MHEKIKPYAGRTTVSDGAWGTLLAAQGLSPGDCPDIWNLERPEAVQAVARGYVEAGSQVILTNTFRSNRFALAHWSLGDRAAEVAERGAAISRKAAGNAVAVFGSIGPSGKIIMMEEVPVEEILSAFADQAAGLARGGADAILCETFAEWEELALAVAAAGEATDLPVVASMSFDSGPERTATMMGVKPSDLAARAAEAGASVVGANCGAGPANLLKVVALLRQATKLPIWVKPNAGLPETRAGKTIFPMGPEEFAGFVPALVQAGANFLGGCCGTTPEHVRAIRRAVEAL